MIKLVLVNSNVDIHLGTYQVKGLSHVTQCNTVDFVTGWELILILCLMNRQSVVERFKDSGKA